MTMSPPNAPISKIYRMREVVSQTQMGRSTIYEMLDSQHARHDPSFPRPFALGARSRGFLASEIDAWVTAKAMQRL